MTSGNGRYTSKVVVVTGAARGLGRGIAMRFGGEGATVVLADLDDKVHETADELTKAGVRALAVTTDVADPGAVAKLFALTAERYGRLDVSVHNAGVIAITKIEDIKPEEWDYVLAVNTKGVFLCCQAAAGVMRSTGRGGRILNAASGQARQGFIYTPHYAASKFGVVGLTQSLAKELASDAITVNANCTGIVSTDMWDYNDRMWGSLLGPYKPGELMAEWVSKIPLGRAGTTDDVANLLLFLGSDEASYITGQTINIDGGMFMN